MPGRPNPLFGRCFFVEMCLHVLRSFCPSPSPLSHPSWPCPHIRGPIHPAATHGGEIRCVEKENVLYGWMVVVGRGPLTTTLGGGGRGCRGNWRLRGAGWEDGAIKRSPVARGAEEQAEVGRPRLNVRGTVEWASPPGALEELAGVGAGAVAPLVPAGAVGVGRGDRNDVAGG